MSKEPTVKQAIKELKQNKEDLLAIRSKVRTNIRKIVTGILKRSLIVTTILVFLVTVLASNPPVTKSLLVGNYKTSLLEFLICLCAVITLELILAFPTLKESFSNLIKTNSLISKIK